MQNVRTALLRCAVLGVVLALATAMPRTARAELLRGLSLRVGGYLTSGQPVRDFAGSGAPGIGLQYDLPWVPKLLGSENWSTNISVDFYYRDWELGLPPSNQQHVFRYVPVSITQVYHFEEQDGLAPYLGFCVTAATYGSTSSPERPRQGTVTRFGGGLVVGTDLGHSRMFLEGRYEKFFRGRELYVPDGFRATLGYRF